MLTRVFIAAGAIILTAPCGLSAQPGSSRLSVVGGLEYAHITEDEGFLGAGLGGTVGLQWHVSDVSALEVEVSAEHHVRDLDLTVVAYDPQGRPLPLPYTERWEGTATFVLGLFSHRFGASRAPVAVWGGGGWMTHGGTLQGPLTLPQVPPNYTLQPVDLEERRGQSSSAFTLDGGAGVDLRVAERLIVRPFGGFRLTMAEGVGPKYIIRGGVRVALGL